MEAAWALWRTVAPAPHTFGGRGFSDGQKNAGDRQVENWRNLPAARCPKIFFGQIPVEI
jgi:hypothetical protein